MEDFADLLAGAQSGDETAFTAVFRSTQPIVLRYLRALGSAAYAEDLAAETWVAALRNLRGFAGDERAFRSWLLTIARARWVDWLRSSARRPEAPYEDVPESVAAQDVHAEVEQAMSTEAAVALIATLPPDQAEVISLRVIAGLEVADVAAVVGKTPNHVRVLAHRGLRRLATLLPATRQELL